MNCSGLTLGRHLLDAQRKYPEIGDELCVLMMQMGFAAKIL